MLSLIYNIDFCKYALFKISIDPFLEKQKKKSSRQ